MAWPALSRDLNPIENVWGFLARAVYRNGHQYDSVEDLKRQIAIEWERITLAYYDSGAENATAPLARQGKAPLQLHRNTVFALGFLLTCLTSGGLCFGFGPFYSRLVKELQWHDLCPPNTTKSCSDQEVQLQNVYSTGILMTVLGQTVFGTFLDMIGPRYMTVIAYLFSMAGNVFLAMGDSRDGTDGLLVAGYALIGFGGMGILYASLQLSTLFREPALYTSVLVAAYSFSGYMFVLLELDISRQTFFLAYAVLIGVSMILVYLIFPVHHVLGESVIVTTPGFHFIPSHFDTSKLKQLWTGLKRQLKRRDFWVYVAVRSMLFLVIIFAGGAVPSVIASLVPDTNESSRDLKTLYTNYLYPLLSYSSFLLSPICGYLMVHRGFHQTFFIAIAIFALLCGSFMLPSLPAQNLSFALMAAANAFLTIVQYVYIMSCFPHELYGMLAGLSTALVFVYGLLNFDLTALAQYSFGENNNYVFLMLLGTTLATIFLVPFVRQDTDVHESDLQLDLLSEQHTQEVNPPEDVCSV
ncbi:hypothetical protein H310_08403 [Aphanomyces invadans]|uniref:Major facilitator superfamily (MFS) profile domain-containing protein n=1 Tax=Aphanomyces invadans TaxID=157072 RepID=A0A024TY75_9STRA|nr:hypothetical protein H310_08403 [Aphanomyces invadans]ETV98914.1 hypothetical protein H310_08403 [Aphanomyces invadans]|eukprot:XP_008872342.1 hypothetical protein H310_08403 [Aphanomyces invadans]